MADRTGQKIDNYRLLRLLGQGTFGEVYLAEHQHKRTIVAVKMLTMQFSPEMVEDFLRETRVLFLLRHPHIVPLLDFGLENQTPFLVVEYAPNGTLRQRHRQGERVPLSIVNAYVQQAALALQYAHEQRLIHRDVNPQNMLLGQKGQVLLSDFGVAAIVHSERSVPIQGITGTISYMAPEQLQGKPGPASDQYALAVCAYEWLCGSRPFTGSTVEIVTQHLSATPERPRNTVPNLPAQVEEIVLQALAKDPGQRFPSIASFAAALQQASQLATGPTRRFASTLQTGASEISALTEPGFQAAGGTISAPFISSHSPANEHTIPDAPVYKHIPWNATQPVASATPLKRKPGGRRWLLVGIIASLLLLLSSGIFIYYTQTLSTPQKTLAAYCDGLKTHNAPEVFNQLDVQLQRQTPVSQLQVLLNALGNAKVCTYSDIQQNGSFASSTVHVVFAKNIQITIDVILILENGNWRVDKISNRPS